MSILIGVLIRISPQSHILLELLKYDQLFLDVHKVEIQTARLTDISTTFRMALRDKSKSVLLLFAKSLRVRIPPFVLFYFLLTRTVVV